MFFRLLPLLSVYRFFAGNDDSICMFFIYERATITHCEIYIPAEFGAVNAAENASSQRQPKVKQSATAGIRRPLYARFAAVAIAKILLRQLYCAKTRKIEAPGQNAVRIEYMMLNRSTLALMNSSF